MKRLVGWTVTFAALAGAGILFYKFMLSDEAKQSISTAAQSVRKSCEDIASRVNDLYGTEMEEDVTQHQREVARQWERLGY